jgi:hypothetical protein
MSAEFLTMVAAIHKIIHSCHILSVKCVALFEGNMDKNHHGAQFCISVSVLHQSSGKFSLFLYLGFIALLPEHHLLHTIVFHVTHSFVGRNQSSSKFCVWF